jgi:protein subunit release factor A
MEGVARLQRELLVPVAARRTELLGGTDRVVADASRIGQHDGVEILDDDLRIDIYRGPRNDCAVRVTHLPTGTVINVTDYETVAENQEQALRLLRDALDRATA